MRRLWLTALLVLVASCGVRPSGPTDAGDAPTGVAPGVTLYFVDGQGELRPQPRESGRLGTVSEALALLLAGPGGSNLHTEITSGESARIVVTTAPGVLRLRVPLAVGEVTPLGIDQIVCTALGAHVQSGGSRTTRVQVEFTLDTPESEKLRTCPLIG